MFSGKVNDSRAQLFETLLSSIRDFAYVFDREGRFVYANQALLDLWGLTLEQVVGKNFFELVRPAELASRLQRQVAQVVTTGRGLTDETPYTSPTGAGGHYEYIFVPVFAADGSVEAVAGTTREISGHRNAEDALAAEKEVLQQVAEGAPLADVLDRLVRSVEAQSADGMLCSILMMDETGERLLHGAAPSLPKEYNDAIHGVRIDAGVGSCGTAAYERRTVCASDIETDPLWKDYRHLALQHDLRACCSTPIVSIDGRILGTAAMYYRQPHAPSARDQALIRSATHLAGIVIEREQAEQRLRQALLAEQQARSEAEAANQAKDRFLAVLSHELRTPLSPVVMAVTAMHEDPQLPPHLKDDIAMVRRNIELETTLIDDLLDVSRITTGKLRLHLQPVVIHRLLDDVLHDSSADVSAKQLRMEKRFAALESRVQGDPARLQQVFWNLLRNAIKFSQAEDVITVRTDNPLPGVLRVEVSDTGAGIAPQMLPRIFNAFEQGDVGTTRQFGGLGLGLSISKALVEMHGGSIEAASEGAGRGCRFTIEFPTCAIAADKNVAPSLSHHAEPRRTDLRVLLVEDHDDTARLLGRLLTVCGYSVRTAGSVASAVELVEAEPFDVLVSDIGLPDADGYELMRQVQSRCAMKGIALSGYGMEDDVRRSREAGFVEHVVKPVNVAHLSEIIRRVTAETVST
jgi:PAS domain S-box-containing protein